MLSKEEIRAEIHYDRRTGEFTRIGKRRKPWRLVKNEDNYSMEVQVKGQFFPAQIVAWMYVNGGRYREDILHANGDPMENSLCNIITSASRRAPVEVTNKNKLCCWCRNKKGLRRFRDDSSSEDGRAAACMDCENKEIDPYFE